MRPKDRFVPSGFEQKNGYDASGFPNGTANSDRRLSLSPRLSARQSVYVVSEEILQGQALAGIVIASGYHVKVYNDVAGLAAQRPTEGIVLAHETATIGVAEVLQTLSNSGLWLPVIGFGVDVDSDTIIAGMKAGAMDYLVGDVSPETIISKILKTAEQAQTIFEVRGKRLISRSSLARLSDRERQVLSLLVTGLSNKVMARELAISPRTVEVHRMNMMGKIGATSGAQAIRIWIDAADG